MMNSSISLSRSSILQRNNLLGQTSFAGALLAFPPEISELERQSLAHLTSAESRP